MCLECFILSTQRLVYTCVTVTLVPYDDLTFLSLQSVHVSHGLLVGGSVQSLFIGSVYMYVLDFSPGSLVL